MTIELIRRLAESFSGFVEDLSEDKIDINVQSINFAFVKMKKSGIIREIIDSLLRK